MHWSKAQTKGDHPTEGIRSHTATVVGRKIFVFGGSDINDKFNDLMIFDTKTMFWSKPKTNGADGCIPNPHRAHTATLVDKRLFIFGGGDGPNYFKDLFVLDTETLTWTKPVTTGNGPGPRRAHTANLVNGKTIYIFGGGDGNKALNEVYSLDTDSLSWTLIKPTGTIPKSRGYHSSVLIGNTKIGIFGGSDGQECFDDYFIFDCTNHSWTEQKITNKSPILSQTSFNLGKTIAAFGGHDANDYINSLRFFNQEKLMWEDVPCTGIPPPRRGYHCCCYVDHRLFVIGGYDGNQCFSDVQILDVGVLAYLELN
ncbi:hypothetical protein DLAC_00326 [Tieghemostelium lacteum]|uniref:Kelch repeat-containing protein n=1 Tax=Tieghemostelium lacteum TaxID=361077 RepID=A0A152A9F7_TIELA|nr:hypothetical protein DLAC_00326 [Tieghemostelium lacteum]|eukprot:KYR02856.1 hypothetical protein DLAC_00326 [Tieghemostelium lacteum]